MARWEEAHDALLDLYRFHNRPEAVEMLNEGWYRPNLAAFEASEDPAKHSTADFFRRTFLDFGQSIAAQLFNADPIYVDPEMMTVAEAAAESFQPEPIVETDIPCETGFLYVPRAVVSHLGSESGGTVHFGEGESSGNLFLLPGPLDPGYDDHDASWDACLWEIVGPNLCVTFFNRTRIGLRFQRANLAPYGVEIPGDERGPAWRDFRFLQTIWRLMAQTIAVADHRLPGGQFRKRAERLHVEPKRVTVVTLRRPHPGESEEHRDVPWSHRWIVSGHWRRQWYSSLSLHRQIWISPYVKGPEDQPLVVRKVRAFQLVR
jgi:hypothetical protein